MRQLAPSIGAFLYVNDAPIGFARPLIELVDGLLSRMVARKHYVSAVDWDGAEKKSYAWSIERALLLAAEPRTGTLIAGNRTDHDPAFACHVALRLPPDLPRGDNAPPQHRLVLEVDQSKPEESEALALDWLRGLLRIPAPTPLHGGAFLAQSFDEALTECSGVYINDPPRELRARIREDNWSQDRFWTLARRAYPVTALGPSLAVATGGDEAVAATGAATVETIGESLLVRAVGRIAPAMDAEALREMAAFRRLLWPHTIQNPADAAPSV